jgi:proteasome lid subunit RPN8/RPN11
MLMAMQLLSISKSEIEKFKKEANASGGAEVCAVMVGRFGSFSGQVDEIRMVHNAAPDIEAGFIMDPQQYLDAILDTDLYEPGNTIQYVGIIHSHYFDRAYPSIADWNGAVHGLVRAPYLIYSVVHEELNAFYWNTREFIKLEYLVCETT